MCNGELNTWLTIMPWCNKTTNHCTTETYNTEVSLYSTYCSWWLCITKHTATVINSVPAQHHHTHWCHLPLSTLYNHCFVNIYGHRSHTCPCAQATMDTKQMQMTFIVIWPPDNFFLTSCFILLANYFQFIFRWLWSCYIMMDPRPRHHRPRQMTQHSQLPLWATACRVEMGGNWTGMMGAVGHNEGEHNKITVKWEWQQWRNSTPPTPSLTSHCSWGGSCVEWQQQQQLMTGRWQGWGKWNEKKAQETSSMSLGPQVCFFSFHFHFTNKLFRY